MSGNSLQQPKHKASHSFLNLQCGNRNQAISVLANMVNSDISLAWINQNSQALTHMAAG